jgi:hypothetical protein
VFTVIGRDVVLFSKTVALIGLPASTRSLGSAKWTFIGGAGGWLAAATPPAVVGGGGLVVIGGGMVVVVVGTAVVGGATVGLVFVEELPQSVPSK